VKIGNKTPIVESLHAGVEQVEGLATKQRAHTEALHAGEAKLPADQPIAPHLSFSNRLLDAEAKDPDSPIEAGALPHLRQASEKEVMRAWSQAKTLQETARTLHQVARFGPELMEESVKGLPPHYAPREMSFRDRLSSDITAAMDLLQGFEELIDPSVTEALQTVHDRLQQDMRDLVGEHGSKLLISGRALGRAQATRRAAGIAPNARQLPASKHLRAEQVQTVETAAGALAGLFDTRGLADSLVAIRDKVPAEGRPSYDRALGAYAMLVDEAQTAPDYNRAKGGARDRVTYRARRAAGFGAGRRQGASTRTLHRALNKVLRAANPLATLQSTLHKEFARELGVPEHESKTWAPSLDAMHGMLSDEVFVPLRALNERGASEMGRAHGVDDAVTNRVVWDLTQSVFEGSYNDWRANNAGSAAQLAHLDPQQKQAWLEPMSLEHQIQTKDGPVVMRSQEATEGAGHEVFWSTKIGGMSHAFDTMTHCALAAYSNTRNQVLMVNDPRWPTQAGRAYLRMSQDPETKGPIMYLEGLKEDARYDGDPAPLEHLLVQHALQKADAMGAKLTLSQNLLARIEDLELPGEWRTDQKYALAPALLVEAATVYGSHDWVATKAEVRTMRDPQFHVDMAAWDKN
jgi:hypothetical protein